MHTKTMFDLKNNRKLSKELQKAYFYRYFPTSLATLKKNRGVFDIKIPREDSYVSSKHLYFS